MTFTAWLTTNDSLSGADAGISVSESEVVDGYRDEKGFVAHSDKQDWVESASLFPEADDVLTEMGYARTGQWIESGGQWAAEVELKVSKMIDSLSATDVTTDIHNMVDGKILRDYFTDGSEVSYEVTNSGGERPTQIEVTAEDAEGNQQKFIVSVRKAV